MTRALKKLKLALVAGVAIYCCYPFLAYVQQRRENLRVSREVRQILLSNLSPILVGQRREVVTVVDQLFRAQNLAWIQYVPPKGKPIQRGDFRASTGAVHNQFDILFGGRSFGAVTFSK